MHVMYRLLPVVLLACGAHALADNHAEAEREARQAEIEQQQAEVAAAREAQREEIEKRRREAREQREEMRRRQAEMEVIAKELAENSLELAEMTRALEPEIRERIARSLVIADRPVLGINIGPIGESEDGVAGVGVTGVTPGWPADAAGVRSGDIVTAIGERSLAAATYREAERRLMGELDELAADEPISLTIDRDGKVQSVEVVPRSGVRYRVNEFVEPRIAVVQGPGSSYAYSYGYDSWLSGAQRAWTSLELVPMTPGLGRYFGTDSGLLVLSVPEDVELPLEEGDVIVSIDGRAPTSVDHGMRILRSYDVGEPLSVSIMRDKRKRTLDLTVPE